MSSEVIRLVLVFLGVCAFSSSQSPDPSDKGCGNPADIVFVLDESGSIWGPHFTKQLEFVERVVESFDVSPGQTHIGLETFGNEARVIFHLGELKTEDEHKAAIRGVQQKRGETMTHEALRRMRTEMFTPQYARPGYTHICIVITDGESNHPDLTSQEAALAHEEDIVVFAVGVGHAINERELNAIASKAALVFKVEGYEALDNIRALLQYKACEVVTPPPPQMIEGCLSYKPVDLIWSISDKASRLDNDLALTLIRDVTSEMKLGPAHVQVGLSPRQCQAGPAIRLREHDTLSGFSDALERRRLAVNVSTHQHLQYIRTQGLTADSGSRADSVKFAVLLIDGPHGANLGRARGEAKRLKDGGVKLILVGVGDEVDKEELKSIGSQSDVITVKSYYELESVKSTIIDQICQGLSDQSISRRWQDLKREIMMLDENLEEE